MTTTSIPTASWCGTGRQRQPAIQAVTFLELLSRYPSVGAGGSPDGPRHGCLTINPVPDLPHCWSVIRARIIPQLDEEP